MSKQNKESKSPGFINMGTSLLLVVFLVLALVVFAVLSLSSAKADRNIVDKEVAASENYYRALTASEEMLKEIDAVLEENLEAIKSCKAEERVQLLQGLMNDNELQPKGTSDEITDEGGAAKDGTAEEDNTEPVKLIISEDDTDEDTAGRIVISWQEQIDDDKYLETEIVLTDRLTESGPESEYFYEIKNRQVKNIN